jgi:hypothetical protein
MEIQEQTTKLLASVGRPGMMFVMETLHHDWSCSGVTVRL